MAWYDNIPIIGDIVTANRRASAEKAHGYDVAEDALNHMATEAKRFQMEGLDRAEAYFDPANKRINQIYGPPGSFQK